MKLNLKALLSERNEYRILALMLILLHLAIWGDVGDALTRSVMLAHLGLFLLWQPLWNSELRLKWSSGLIFLLAAIAFVVWLNWWLMTFWLLSLNRDCRRTNNAWSNRSSGAPGGASFLDYRAVNRLRPADV